MDNPFNHVLYIGPFDEFGGMGAVLNMYKKNIRDLKYVSTHHPSENSSKILSFIRVIFTISGTLLLDRDIKILHIHSAANGSFARKSVIALFGKLCGKKVAFHIHSGSFDHFYDKAGKFKILIKLLLHKMDCVICLSDQWYTFYTQKMGLEKVVIVGNPVELNPILTTQNNSGILNLLFLGMICDNKGIFDLIHYLSNNNYFRLDLINLKIGGNNQIDKLQELLSDPYLNAHIQFCGWVKADFKDKLLSECDLFILPSYFEGLPVSILEAMAFSKPIIATKVGGIPSVVKDGFNGWLFNPGQFKELDAILDQIFKHPSILADFGKNSYSTASQYAPALINQNLSNIYTQLMDPKPNHLTFK